MHVNQKYLIKRNILLFKRLYDSIMEGKGVRNSIKLVAEETGYNHGIIREVYYKRSYPNSPFNVYSPLDGEIIGIRSLEEIIEKAKLLIQEGESLTIKTSTL